MNNKRVGIDISISSTAICIFSEDKYVWYNIASNIKKNSKKIIELKEIKDLELINYLKSEVLYKDMSLSDNIKNKFLIYNRIIKNIENILIRNDISKEYKFFIEGPSYNSKGRSQIDIVVCNHYISFYLMKKGYDITFIPPSNVKKLAGKGNYNKFQMLDSFKNNCLNDEFLNNSDFHNYVLKKEITTKTVPKPIDDLIDSYFICNC